MSKYTPGPWGVYRSEDGPVAIVSNGNQNLDKREPIVFFKGISTGKKLEEDLANARLIAAAPEMYEAIVKILTPGNGLGWRGEFELLRQVALKVRS